MAPDFFWNVVTQPLTTGLIPILCITIFANFLLGVILALRDKVFQWTMIADFITTSLLPYVLGWYILDVVTAVTNNAVVPDVVRLSMTGVSMGAYGLIMAGQMAKILQKVASLGLMGGVQQKKAKRAIAIKRANKLGTPVPAHPPSKPHVALSES